jgi:hypothetical protein
MRDDRAILIKIKPNYDGLVRDPAAVLLAFKRGAFNKVGIPT